MYEVGMSATGRIEPNFEPSQLHQSVEPWQGEAPVSLDAEHLFYEEDTGSDFKKLLMKSSVAMLLAITAISGYQLMGSGSDNTQVAETTPLSLQSQSASGEEITSGQTETGNIRKIDLTQTASIETITQSTGNTLGKPVPLDTITSNENGFHIVKSGDTLSAISRKFKIKTSDLMAMNNIENPRSIKPGMKLIISK